jgi:hypothetical protein
VFVTWTLALRPFGTNARIHFLLLTDVQVGMKDDKLDHSMSRRQSPFVQQEAKVSVLAKTFVDRSGQNKTKCIIIIIIIIDRWH